ncbi:MAG: protein kinase, partial [Kofleriaceae bacterium]
MSDSTSSSDDSLLREVLGMHARPPPPALATGQVIDGTYRVECELGAGGMGRVYRARDLKLGRMVALKLLASIATEHSGERLAREAAALARLAHPNVVTVYRVDTWCDHPYVAMEYVDGATARGWVDGAPRSWIEIVRLYVAAGRGLAAAHQAGLVHRDFKPDNVLVGKDGRIRVADFGLARTLDEIESEPQGDRVAPLADVTKTGAVMGTPAYMAPEQRQSGKVGPVADQFSFAVALWEALSGARPFAGDTDPVLVASIHARRIREAPPHLPRRLVRALHRALSVDPSARFASMDDLIAELEAVLPAPRGSVWPFVVGAVATAGFGVIAVRAWWPDDASSLRPSDAAESVPSLPPGLVDLDAAKPLTRYVWEACAYAPAFVDTQTLSFDLTVGDAVDLHTMPVIGGEPVRLTSEPPWEWRSHPGARPGEVVYLVHDQEVASRSRVDVIDVTSRQRRTVQTGNVSDAVYAGDDLVYADDAALHRIRDGHDEVLFAISPDLAFADLTVSVRGDRVAFNNPSRGPAPCWFSLDDPQLHCLDGQIVVGRPAFSATGDALYYAGLDGIRRADLATGESRIVVPGVASSGVTVAPDGSSLVYSDCGQRADLLDVTVDPPAKLVDDNEV